MSVIELAIGPGGAPGLYRVEVFDSPAGQASVIVGLDVDALLARRGRLQEAVLASAVTSRRVLAEAEQPVSGIGQELFAALLGTGEVAGRYRAAEALAADRGQGLRVVLRIDTPALAGLPWEAMFDQAAGTYVCRHNQLVRHVPVASVPAPLRVEPPLRILGVVSSPRGLPRLDVEKEQSQLARALARPLGQGLVRVRWAPTATWADLQDLLLDETWHVLHFIGHGDFDSHRDEGVLALETEDGRADLVAAHRLVDLLRQARPMPRLVVLNSCSGAAAGASDLFSGTAAALVRGGVTAVAAMQYEISDPAAVAFARGFYAAIARGRGVDDAISSGRVGILGLGDKTLEWVTPVLYLRGHETRLFTLPVRTSDSSPDATGNQGVPTARRRLSDAIAPTAAERQPLSDSPAGHATTRAPHPSAAQDQPEPEPASPGRFRLIRTLAGHTSRVHQAAFSPDGKLLATASDDRTARLWEVSSGAPGRALTGRLVVLGVAFSPDGKLLATASRDTAELWEMSSGTQVRTLNALAQCVTFSPDGKLLATGCSNSVVRLWKVSSGAQARALTGHRSWVCGIAFSPDGTMLATASLDGTARLWETATGEHIRTLTGHAGWVRGVAFSPDGKLLATASDDKTARLWETATGAHLRAVTGHTSEKWGKVNGVAFSPDGALLATASEDYTAQLWETATGAHVCTLACPRSVNGVAFSPDGTLLATASGNADEGTAMLWG